MSTAPRSAARHPAPPRSAPPRIETPGRRRYIREFQIHLVLAASLLSGCVAPHGGAFHGSGPYGHYAALDAVESLAARGVPAAGSAAFQRAAARLEAANVLDPGCRGAPIFAVFVPRAEWERDWYADRITGETWATAAGWLSAVKDAHGTKGYDAHETLEHELMHALLDCSGADDVANGNHVGSWWDGIR